MKRKCIAVLMLATSCIVSCNRDEPTVVGGIPVESNAVLYRVTGLKGLIEFGDDLVVMTYPKDSRESRIRQENIDAAKRNLLDKRSGSALAKQAGRYLVKIRDFEDETDHRFFYLERTANGALVFRAVCSESWEKSDPSDASLAVCDITYPLDDLVVYFETSEKTFTGHGQEIAKRVLEVVRAKQ